MYEHRHIHKSLNVGDHECICGAWMRDAICFTKGIGYNLEKGHFGSHRNIWSEPVIEWTSEEEK